MSLRIWFRTGARLGIALILIFCLLEATLLIFDHWVFRNWLWGFDPELGAQVRPHAVYGKNHANQFGFNDRDYPLHPPAGGFRVLVLSDSFNWAGARDWNYVGLLEQDLQAQFGEKVEVINAGYPGTHTAEELGVLEKFGMRYQPDLVVLGFFAGNDFSDAEPWRRRIAYGGAVIDLDLRRDSYGLFLGKPVVWRSRFYTNLVQWWKAVGLRRGGGRMSRPQFLRLERSRMLFCDPERSQRYAPNVKWILDSVDAMRHLVEGRGKRFMVAVYPAEFQADPRLRREVAEHYEIDISEFEWERPQNLLRDFCRREGIEFHDLLPQFQRETASGRTLFIPSNTHWNQEGNRLAADSLREILTPIVRARFN